MGGNYFIVGGAVKGGQILGKYPKSFDHNEIHYRNNGRMVPSSSWESVWYGVAEWLGVKSAKMESVFPNLRNFNAEYLFPKRDMFKPEHQS